MKVLQRDFQKQYWKENYIDTKIEINASTKSIEVGESKILTATILPSNATDKKISWESSDESIAMINEEEKLVAKGAGTVDITVTTSNGKTSTIKVNVKETSTVENNTTIFSYDEFIKSSNNKGFLLQSIQSKS